jgi:4-hydroxybenzoate polyprenyltransferase
MSAYDIIGCLRVRQWTKNILIFAALVFSRHVHQTEYTLRVTAAFVLFSLVSGAVYILNDLVDVGRDRAHPVKRNRPIASGQVTTTAAVTMLAALVVVSLPAAFLLNIQFGLILVLYIVIQSLYSFLFKNIVILDVFVISLGFLLRVIAGAVIIEVPISNWILVCTMLLSLFLVLSKRRHELTLLEGEADSHRLILREYSPYLLDQMIGIVTSATLVAYTIFTMSAETIEKFGPNMVLTVPFVLYGIFRYLYLVHQKNAGGSPEEVLLTDLPLQIDIVLYGVVSLLVIYV